MATTSMRLVIDADTDGAVREIRKVDSAIGGLDTTTGKAEKSGKRMGAAAKTAIAVGLGAAATAAFGFGRDSVNAFKDAEAAMASAEAMLDRNNKGWRDHKKEIDKTIAAHTALSGFDDEDLYKSFANLARVSGDTTKGLQLQQTAMDVARARGISLEAATNLVAKASVGQTKGLKALGIVLPKTATGLDAVNALNKNFAGSAKAYGDTAAGQADKLAVSWGNLQEDIGQQILPAVTALMGVLLGGIQILRDHGTEVKILGVALGAIGGTWLTIVAAQKAASAAATIWTGITKTATAAQWLFNAAMSANPIVLVIASLVAIGVALVVAYKKSETFRKIVNAALGAVLGVAQTIADFFTDTIPDAFQATVDWVTQNWKGLATLISGPFAPIVALATDAFGIRSAMTGAIGGMLTDIGGFGSRIFAKGKGLADDALSGFKSVAWGIAGLVQDRLIQPMIDKLTAVFERGKSFSSNIVSGIKSVAWEIAALVNDRIITPLREKVTDVIERGKAFGTNLITAMGTGARETWEAAVNGFKSVLNKIIGIINKIPFVNIPLLAEGGVIRGPQLAVVGEDGPEVVVPVGAKRRARGQRLLTQAAMMLGSSGDGPGSNRFMNNARGWGIPMLADGAVVYGGGVPASNWASTQVGMLKAKATTGWGSDLMRFAREQLGNLVGLLPTPAFANPVLQGAAQHVKQAAVDVIKGVEATKDQWGLGNVLAAQSWAQGVMGRPYVWGGGHGGWNFNLPGYDCSGFSSHAAKKAGAGLGAPGTTMSLYPGSRGATGLEPMLFGFRGMGSGNPRSQHMGTKILGTWYQFGNPGHTGGGDSQWDSLRQIPALPIYHAGGYVRQSGMARLQSGELVLNRQEAAADRAGARGATQVSLHFANGMEWLAQFVEARVDDMSEAARRRSLAAGAVR